MYDVAQVMAAAEVCMGVRIIYNPWPCYYLTSVVYINGVISMTLASKGISCLVFGQVTPL